MGYQRRVHGGNSETAIGHGGQALGLEDGMEGNMLDEAREKDFKVVKVGEPRIEVLPQPPTSPRPSQPVPPSTFRRAQMKRDALGLALSTRRRAPTGTGSRFPNCGPPPPL